MQLGIGPGWPGGYHHGTGFTDQGTELLGVGGAQIHQLHCGAGLADAAGNRLAEAVAEAVLAQIANGCIVFARAALTAPGSVVIQPEAEVMAQQGPMTHRHRGDLGQPIHALQRLQHAAGVGAHQAVVIEAEIGGYGAGIGVEQLLGAVVQAKGIAGVEDAGAVVEGKDRVGPVQVWSAEKLEAVGHATGGVGAQIELFAAFYRPAFEGPVHLILKKLDRNLGAHDLDLGVEVEQVAYQSRVVGLGVAHDQVIDCFGVDQLLQQRQPAAFKFEVAGIDQGGALAPHQEAVVGGAVAQAKLNIKAAAVPVERADRGGVRADRLALQAEPDCGCDGTNHGSIRDFPNCRKPADKKGPAGGPGLGGFSSLSCPLGPDQPSTCTCTVVRFWALGAVTVSRPSR